MEINLPRHKNVAFVLGLSPNGLGVIRSLGRNNISVVGFDYTPKLPGFFSSFCTAKICPNPIYHPEDLVELLIEEAKSFSEKGILFPTSDEFVLLISRFRDELKDYFYYALPRQEIIEKLLNKKWQYEIAENAGIPYPETFYPENIGDIVSIKDKVKYPSIIKPCYTHLWKEKNFGVKGIRVNNEKELCAAFRNICNHDIEVILQSIVLGPCENLFEICCYCKKSLEPIGFFTKQKLRQFPGDFGLGSFMLSVKIPELEQYVIKFQKETNYIGPLEMEFKRDGESGQYKLIEVNSRLTLQNSLLSACGVNLPLIQYCDIINCNDKQLMFKKEYIEGFTWMWWEIDFQSFLELRKQKKISIFSWVKSIFLVDSFAIFSLDDPIPFLRSIPHKGILNKLVRLKKKI